MVAGSPGYQDLTVGVLALQGDVREHLRMLERLGATARPVKWPRELEGLDGLIIPGGESTTIGKLLTEYDFLPALKQGVEQGLSVFGTCAGLILCSTGIAGYEQPHLDLVSMEVQRNGFGRQRESFETDLEIPAIGGDPFTAVFIRAPYIESLADEAEPLASYDGKIVMARQGRHLVCAFHPELTSDARVHRLFLDTITGARS